MELKCKVARFEVKLMLEEELFADFWSIGLEVVVAVRGIVVVALLVVEPIAVVVRGIEAVALVVLAIESSFFTTFLSTESSFFAVLKAS